MKLFKVRLKAATALVLAVLMVILCAGCRNESENKDKDIVSSSNTSGSNSEVDYDVDIFGNDSSDSALNINPGSTTNTNNSSDNNSVSFETEDPWVEAEKNVVVTPNKTVTVNTGEVVNSFFDGVGANIITQQWMKTNNVIDEAAWQIDVKRIKMLRPKVIRMWLQVDWFEVKKGVYDFETQRMQWLYKYLDVFKEIGTTVEFTYSWKSGTAYDWYGIPGLRDTDTSAPADLEHFAESCSVFLQEFWRRGYDNVKYLSFANEPNGSWDFECYGDQLAYYIQIAKYVDARLKKDGIRDKVKLMGCESSDNIAWVTRCAKEGSQYFDLYSYHTYTVSSENITSIVQSAVTNKANPFYITEFAEYLRDGRENSFQRGYAGYLINGANNGLAGLMNWMLHGYGGMDNDGTHFWLSQANGGDVGYQYYINSMFTNYIESGSKVVKSTVEGGDDIRSATFISPSGDITVVVEYDESTDKRDLTLNFSKSVGKTFYKHVYNVNTELEQNAIIPKTVATFNVGKTLKDKNVDKCYSVVVYTTIKPYTQVAVSEPRCSVSVGSSVKLSAEVIDNTGGVIWSVLEGKGTVTQDGLFTPASNAVSGDTVAVKAASEKDPTCYGVAYITIS